MKIILHVFKNHERAKLQFRADYQNYYHVRAGIYDKSTLSVDMPKERHLYVEAKIDVNYTRGIQPYEVRIRDFIDLIEFTKIWGPNLCNLGREV